MKSRRWIDISKNYWTDEDIGILEECYKNMASMNELKKRIPNHTVQSSMNKASKLGLTKKYMKSNHSDFKAEYQDYDWCHERFINQGKTIQQISEETGYGKRVLEKWIYEKHRFSNRNYRQLAKITPLQYSIILAGTLGDGHIDKREKYAIYIESHADNQKDYLFRKYEILKNLCASPPSYYDEKDKEFNGKLYHCQSGYRLQTRALDALKPIREMSICQRLDKLDELGMCTHTLDDGYRSDCNWEVCLGDWTQEEIDRYIQIMGDKFLLHPYQIKDKRYVLFNSEDTKIIDQKILKNIPNELDIIQYKIINRKVS